MAAYAPAFVSGGASLFGLTVFWGLFLLLLLLSLYAAVLDMQYIRLQYLVGRREIFQETLGSEAFRRALRESQERGQEEKEPE